MGDLDPYLDRFSESGKRVLEGALSETRRREQNFISPEHILFALIEEETGLFNAAMRNLSIEPQSIRPAVEKRLENSRQHTGRGFRIAPETTELFKRSMDRARSQGRRIIEASDILYTLTADRLNLLNDILQNPAGSHQVSNRIVAEDEQRRFFSQLQATPSNFLAHFSLKDLMGKNDSPFGLFHGLGSAGGGVSGGNSEQTTHTKHESFSFRIKSKDSNNFNEAEFISSLKKCVEDSINQSRLKITKTDSRNSSNFRFEYEKGKIKGRIEISGKLMNEYYELNAMIDEKSGR